jgi:simple sugar transport system permease protein
MDNGIFKLSNIKSKINIQKQTLLLITILVLLVVGFGIFEEGFLTKRSISSMVFQLPEIGLLSFAMMLPYMVGGINLSISASANLSAVLASFFIIKVLPIIIPVSNSVLYIGVVFMVALIIGLLTGLLNGYLVGYIRAPSILATLATMAFYTGISIGLTKGSAVTGFSKSIGLIGSETVLGVPTPFLVFVGVSIILFILLNHTTFGFKIRMLGTNPVASRFSGINNKDITMKIFILSGILSSIAGVLIMSRTMSASYQYGASTYVLLTILINVLAGVVTGSGSVINIFITVLVLQVISTGFHMLLVGIRGSSFFKDFAWGILLIMIFIINYYSKKSKYQE